ncbi:MAG: WG repeat-containing protein [Bacteroidetes bacterium]|nr:WG repeat-containing protein [Bacteroidota bacterium]
MKTKQIIIAICLLLFGAIVVQAEELESFRGDNDKYGFKNATGEIVVPAKYDWVSDFFKGLAVVRIGDWDEGKHGFIDQTGKVVIPLKYDEAGDFSEEGLASVTLDNKSGFIDITGKEVIPLKYDGAGDFSDGKAWVVLDEESGFIDITGKIIPMKYETMKTFEGNYAPVKLNGKWGLIDREGNEAVPCRYDESFNMGWAGEAVVYIAGKKILINERGECIKYCEDAPTDHPKAVK